MSEGPERVVKGVEVPPPLILSATTENPPARATATSEQDRKSLGQRRVNLIWESTQAVIAMAVTSAVIYSEIKGVDSKLLGNAFTLIIAIYFVRMNHVKTGGVGGTDSR